VSDSTIFFRCDPEWGGEYCDEPVISLPSQLKDSFSRAPSLSHWHILTGGKLSTVCGAVASGAALHFSGVCNFVFSPHISELNEIHQSELHSAFTGYSKFSQSIEGTCVSGYLLIE